MTLLTPLLRLIRAVGSGLIYALTFGTLLSGPFTFLLLIQPPCNQAVSVCEDSGAGLGAVLLFWVGALAGFATGFTFSRRRFRPFSNALRRIDRWLRRLGKPARIAWLITALSLVAAATWFGIWLNSRHRTPPPISMSLEVPLNESLGVGLARIETSHQGGGCVSFRSFVSDQSSFFSSVYATSSTTDSHICPGVNQPESQELLLVAYHEQTGTVSKASTVPVQVHMQPNWYDEATFGAVSFPSPEPRVLSLDPISGTVNGEPLIWRIRLAGIAEGFAVPVITAIKGDLEVSLYKLDQYDNRTAVDWQVNSPSWSLSCDRHTCELGWAVVAWQPDTAGARQGSVALEVWVFDNSSEPTLTVTRCDQGDGTYEITCTTGPGTGP